MAEIPLKYLFDYQRAFVLDGSRFKIFLASRQIGKSFTLSCEAVRDCVLSPTRTWLAVSRGERQSREWLKKATSMALLWTAWAREQGVDIGYTATSQEIRFNNGSRILALPANPDTIRGYTANLILDEFAYHEKPEQLWEAIYPTISNPINGSLRCIIASTPNGKNNKFWEIYSSHNSFVKYKVDIHQAVENGLKINIKELREGLGDEDAWRQEFECQPVEEGSTLIPVDLIKMAQEKSVITTRDMTISQMNSRTKIIYVGVDIGRKHDITCIWGVELLPSGTLRTAFIKELINANFSDQRETIKNILATTSVKRLCIDCTGIGAQLAEEIACAFPSKTEQCQFTHAFKIELFTAMQRTFQNGKIIIPKDTKQQNLTKDISAIQKTYSKAGTVSFFAPSNSDGHSDRATALALAIRASGIIDGKPHSQNIGLGQTSMFQLKSPIKMMHYNTTQTRFSKWHNRI